MEKVSMMERLPWRVSTLSTDNVNFCMRSRPYKPEREASQPSGPGRFFLSFYAFFSPPPTPPCDQNEEIQEIGAVRMWAPRTSTQITSRIFILK